MAEEFDFRPLADTNTVRRAKKTYPRSSPNPNGNPPYQPTDGQRNLVKAVRSCGVDNLTIARLLQISTTTLQKHFRRELDQAKAEVVARIGAKCVQKALAGDNTMIMFYLRNFGGEKWRNNAGGALTPPDDGSNGAPPSLNFIFLEAEPQPQNQPPTIDGEATSTAQQAAGD